MKHTFIVFLVLLFPSISWSLATTMELGVRGGMDASSVYENYSAGEVYYLYTLPWQKDLSNGIRVYTRLDSGVGYLRAASKNGGWFAVGGDVVLSLMGGRVELEAGFRPGLLFEDEFGRDDYGGPVQFLSHAGATVNLDRFALSYRYTHISNAQLYDQNTGIDLHLVGVGMRF